MKTSTAAVRKALADPESDRIELLEIYLTAPFTTPTYKYARWDVDVVFNSLTYKPLVFNRSPVIVSTTQQEQRVSFRLDNVSKEFSQLLFQKELSGGRVRCIQVFNSLLADAASYILLFDGSFSMPAADETAVTVDAISWLTRYGQLMVPRRIFQPSCNYRLYDSGCTIDRAAAANVQSSTVQAGSTKTILRDMALNGLTSALTTDPDKYWDEGTFEFTSGANTGQARPVKAFLSAKNTIEVRFPFLNTPVAGDAYSIRRGCNKTKDACNTRFSNLNNFGGFAEVPTQKASLL